MEQELAKADAATNDSQPIVGDQTFAAGRLLEQATLAAKDAFGFPSLRTHQREVLKEVLAGHDCLAVLPTGSGKSLCYALPALVRDGLVLVVSPLIALIRDQTRKFEAAGIPSASLDSMQSPEEKDRVWARLQSGQLKILTISPERLARQDFRARLKNLTLQLVAIDEAHCISHWGSHFRPDYRQLGDYLTEFGSVQKLAVTATATAKVRDDIIRTLKLSSPSTAWAAFARENLSLKVIRANKVAEQLAAILAAVLQCKGSGIVYVPTRRTTRDVHRMLVDAGIKATAYHAGLTPEARQSAQRAFMSGEARVVVATHAFGLGIDKADIRFVHHAGMPGSLEQYVQEIGRAGRDGKSADCWMVFGPRDYHIQRFMLDKSYPDWALLKAVLTAAKEFLQGSVGQSPKALLRHLGQTVSAESDALMEAVTVLCREGLLVRLRASGAGFGGDEVLISEGRFEEEDEIFREYPLRKEESLSKLEAMRTYANLEKGRAEFLEHYFHQ